MNRALAVLMLAAATGPVGSQEPVELRRLFPQEAELFTDRDGLSRLVLPSEIIAACRADLSDLRLFDREDREVAFLVDRAGPVDVEIEEKFAATIHDVNRSEARPRRKPTLVRQAESTASSQARRSSPARCSAVRMPGRRP